MRGANLRFLDVDVGVEEGVSLFISGLACNGRDGNAPVGWFDDEVIIPHIVAKKRYLVNVNNIDGACASVVYFGRIRISIFNNINMQEQNSEGLSHKFPSQEDEKPSGLRSLGIFVWEIAKVIIISLAIIIPLRFFVFQPFIVQGNSMEPNYANGEYLIIDEISYRFKEPQRGDVIVFRFPRNPSQFYIKRVVGLPGETVEVESGRVIITNDQHKGGLEINEESYLGQPQFTPGDAKVVLGPTEYFVLGDNRDASSDSRGWGPLDEEFIIGRSWLRAFPVDRFTKFELPSYELLDN
jgi:signal peptidase I